MKSLSLSKSRYIRGLQCPKALYLDTFRAELARYSSETRAKLAAGNDFELQVKEALAERYKEAAQVVDLRKVAGGNRTRYPEATARLLQEYEGTILLYEAGFRHRGVLVLVDALLRDAEGNLHLFEIKNNSIAKEVFRQDLFLQYYVVAHAATYRIASFSLALRRPEEAAAEGETTAEARPFEFVTLDLTAEAGQNMPVIEERIDRFLALLQGDEPTQTMGEQCAAPYECPYLHYCKRQAKKAQN